MICLSSGVWKMYCNEFTKQLFLHIIVGLELRRRKFKVHGRTRKQISISSPDHCLAGVARVASEGFPELVSLHAGTGD